MVRTIYKKNKINFERNYLQSNRNQRFFNKKPYSDVLSTLKKIFEKLGKSDTLSLLKLQKIWFTEIDSFLSENAFPRKISQIKKIQLNSAFLREFNYSNLQPDLYKKIEKMIGNSFSNPDQFFGYLKKNFNRSITKYEMELLKDKVQFNLKQNILHLTVYDGSISYAINSEIEKYVRIFNGLLPEIKFDGIRCHVGQIQKIHLCQSYITSLAKDWNIITPEKVHQKCMPVFLHRTSKNCLVLVLYVSNESDMNFLKYNLGSEWLLLHLQKKCPELQDVLKKIKFVNMEGIDLEKIRSSSIIFGDKLSELFSIKKRFKPVFKKDIFLEKSFAKDRFSKILRKLKKNK